MFDKLKLLCLITMMYAQMGIENAHASISQYFHPVSTVQPILLDQESDLHSKDADDAHEEDSQSLTCDGNQLGQQISENLEDCNS